MASNLDSRLLSGVTALVAAVERGSFTKAGESLGLSASGVSRAISRFEERIGVRLIERTTRALRLTQEGAKLYELAAPHLAGIEEAALSASGAAAEPRGLLRASINPIFSTYVLAPRLADFKKRFPAIHLDIVQHPDVGDLVSEGIDIAIRFGPQPSSSMSSRLLLETRVMTVAAPAYLQKFGRPTKPEQLASHDCIQFIDPRSNKPFEWEFHRPSGVLPVSVTGRVTVRDVATMVAFCVAGAGIAQVLALGTEALLVNGALVELFPDWPGETYPLYAIRPSRRLPTANVEAFLNFCVEICES